MNDNDDNCFANSGTNPELEKAMALPWPDQEEDIKKCKEIAKALAHSQPETISNKQRDFFSEKYGDEKAVLYQLKAIQTQLCNPILQSDENV
jgi:hypothetical protein